MKKTLLWIGIPSILIIAVATFIFFSAGNGKYRENNIINIETKQEKLLYNGTTYENTGRTYLSENDCYNESGVLNKNYDIDDNGNPINCYNKNVEKDGKWVTYTEYKFGKKYKHEINYENGKENGKYIDYDADGKIESIQNYKNGNRNGEVIFYDNGEIRYKGEYVNGEPEGEHIEYFDGEWMSKSIYKSGEIIDIQDNDEVFKKYIEHYESEELVSENIWNKFLSGLIISNDEFLKLIHSVRTYYDVYYNKIFNDDEEKMRIEDIYRRNYENKSWGLLALYSMMNCGGDPLNPDTYLFNLEDSELAQETYFKNCPKGCKYSDKEGTDFVCE